MKLTLAQLEPHLSKNLAPVYLISGEEYLLKQDACQLIRKAAKQAGFSERTRLSSDTFDEESLYHALYTTSLLAEKRLLELDFTQAAPLKAPAALLQAYGNKPTDNTLLLIDLAKIDDKIAKSAWYKSLEKAGVVISIWPIPREQMPQWIIQRAKRYKLPFTLEAAQALTDFVEGNLSAAAQMLEKVYLLQPKQAIDAALIRQVFSDESRFTVFDFIENAFIGDSARTLHILDHLKTEGTEPALIIWGIARELRLLADLSDQLKQGERQDALFQKYRIFFRRQTAFRRFLSRFNSEYCFQLLKETSQLDRMLKGALPGNIWHSLQLFCLRLV